jgi:hypothetical protein
MLAFEKRMRAKHGARMPETQTEMETRWQNDPEIAREVQESIEDEKRLEQARRRS